jgi:hypothetical protein
MTAVCRPPSAARRAVVPSRVRALRRRTGIPEGEVRFLFTNPPPTAASSSGQSMSAETPNEKKRRRYISLFGRVAGVNALLLFGAVLVTIVVLAPHKISSFAAVELVVLLAALALGAVGNV